MTQIGTSVGVAISTVVFDRVSHPSHGGNGGPIGRPPPGPPPPQPLEAYHAAGWCNFAFSVLGKSL